MLKKMGIPVLALALLALFVPAQAAVHFGVRVGPGYPAYSYPYVYSYPYPYGYPGYYYDPYYPYAYSYPSDSHPYYGGGFYWGGGHRGVGHREFHGNGHGERGFRSGQRSFRGGGGHRR
jgi:hypothetical protein